MFEIQEGSAFYNAYEKDIAVVNIFFGGPTAFGKDTPAKKYQNFTLFLRVWEIQKNDLARLHR